MAINLDYQRGLQRLSTLSPELKAVPDATDLTRNLARAATGQYLNEASTGLAVRGMETENALARQDMRLARRDAGMALPVMVANTGLSVLANREREMAQIEAGKRAEEEITMWRAIGEVMTRFFPKIEQLLRVEGGK